MENYFKCINRINKIFDLGYEGVSGHLSNILHDKQNNDEHCKQVFELCQEFIDGIKKELSEIPK